MEELPSIPPPYTFPVLSKGVRSIVIRGINIQETFRMVESGIAIESREKKLQC